ncbi:MAG TPA: RNA-binding S4 domain-containing protein [Solirubrobacteraceae bacterium]|jgi:ribosome-associated protein|nr:RNA-binding S4 domain-containing protein [Solirubrobacteraceae bacterium]
MPSEIAIRGETIRLGQLLKLAGISDSGSGAKALLAAEPVTVNGARETRRGRQLQLGDLVRVGEQELWIVSSPLPPPPAPPA